ncbi:MAG TPA: TetR/AcrR family transcriptional regulator [Thermoleophilaceae bacterium]|jgi:AcrR family transcriptional regulator
MFLEFGGNVLGVSGSGESLRLEHELPRGRHNLPREVVIRSQRERIIDGVIESVAEKGYAATTVADVIKKAAVSRKTFYEHFADKEECFMAAYDEIMRQLVAQVRDAYEKGGAWRDRVAAGVRTILELLASRPALARFCVVEILAAGPRALARRDEVLSGFTEFIAPGSGDAPSGVRIPEVTAPAVVGAVYSLIYDEIFHGRARELPEKAPEFVYVTLAPYLGPRAAARAARLDVG